MNKVAVFFADGFEEVEAFTPVDYLRRANLDVITVGVTGKDFDFENSKRKIVTSSHGIPIVTDCTLNDFLGNFSASDIDLVFLPGGGKGAQNLSECTELLRFIDSMNEKGKLISAICASPAVVLGKTSAPKGKKWTCYPDMQGESASEYIENYLDKPFVTDKNLITGRAAGASEEFAVELIRILCGEETAKKIKKSTYQR